MIPPQVCVERDGRKRDEHREGDDLLQDLELHKVERSAVAHEAQAVSRNLQAVLEERYAPTDEDYRYKRQVLKPLHLRHLQVPVPSEGHEYVGADKKQDRIDAFHL